MIRHQDLLQLHIYEVVETVDVLTYQPLDLQEGGDQLPLFLHTHTHTYIYIYIYNQPKNNIGFFMQAPRQDSFQEKQRKQES